METGAAIGLINYPRFPTDAETKGGEQGSVRGTLRSTNFMPLAPNQDIDELQEFCDELSQNFPLTGQQLREALEELRKLRAEVARLNKK